jgi:dolichyl-phosphate-mannose-protein mannosyltransferase
MVIITITIINSEYDSSVIPYVQMRSFGAILSAAVVPLGYLTLRDAGHSFTAAIIASLAICFGKL